MRHVALLLALLVTGCATLQPGVPLETGNGVTGLRYRQDGRLVNPWSVLSGLEGVDGAAPHATKAREYLVGYGALAAGSGALLVLGVANRSSRGAFLSSAAGGLLLTYVAGISYEEEATQAISAYNARVSRAAPVTAGAAPRVAPYAFAIPSEHGGSAAGYGAGIGGAF